MMRMMKEAVGRDRQRGSNRKGGGGEGEKRLNQFCKGLNGRMEKSKDGMKEHQQIVFL